MNNLEENKVFNFKNHLIQFALKNFLNVDYYEFDRIHKTSSLRKIINEKKIQKLLDNLISKIKSYKNINPDELSPKDSEEIKKIVISYLLELDRGKYFFDKPFLKFFLDNGYLDVAEEFINRAKKEDGNLTGKEIFQAMRNVWIMNSLQIIWGMSIELTPSIYAYSMLYPYTDNLLDSLDIDLQEKDKFNHKLTKTLKGEKQIPSNAHENRVFALFQDIEFQYNRADFSQVYESILLIQEAQIKSLKQDQNTTMTDDDILPISFFKGGSSVLADAFLVKGNLSKEEMEFSFEYGAFLQLLDDLQDTIEDKIEGHQTIFSINDKVDLDKNIYKLISYIFKVNTPNSGDSQAMVFMKDVISSCSLIMVMDAVGKNHSIVSKKLYKKLESYSKVRLSFYKKVESQLNELNRTFNLKY